MSEKENIYEQFKAQLDAGRKPIIEIGPGGNQLGKEIEHYFVDEGMRARLVGMTKSESESIFAESGEAAFTLAFDLSEFKEHNSHFAQDTWYDRDSDTFSLSYEAFYGKEPPQKEVQTYNGDVEDFITALELNLILIEGDKDAEKLLSLYRESGTELSYVTWLERKVIELAEDSKSGSLEDAL